MCMHYLPVDLLLEAALMLCACIVVGFALENFI